MVPLLLVDPVMLSLLVLNDLTLTKPQGNLFLRAVNSIGAVADIAANVLLRISRTLTLARSCDIQ